MKKYKVVGLPKMHQGGNIPWHSHPHEESMESTRTQYSGTDEAYAQMEDEIKKQKEREKKNQEFLQVWNVMSYDQRVDWVNKKNANFKEQGATWRYKIPERSEAEWNILDDIQDNEALEISDDIIEQINNPQERLYNGQTAEEVFMNSTTKGNKHRLQTKSLYGSLTRTPEWQIDEYKQRNDGSNYLYREGQGKDDNRELEELRQRYFNIEAQMQMSFGDRKGDPTRALHWANKDGKIYRRQIAALKADLQEYYLRKRQQYGMPKSVYSIGNTQVYESVPNTDPQNKIYDDETGEWTGEYRPNMVPKLDEFGNPITERKITKLLKRRIPITENTLFEIEQINELGYVPRKYMPEYADTVTYPDKKNQKLQQKLSDEAEQLFLNATDAGYLPNSLVPIMGKIEDLKDFIKVTKGDFKDYEKDLKKYDKQQIDDAAYIGVDYWKGELFGKKFKLGSSPEHYKALRKKMSETPTDQYLMKIYKTYFQDQDPNNVKFTEEERNSMIAQGWADGSMDAIKQVAWGVAAGGLAAPYVVSALTTIMTNPLFQAAMTGYFAYTAPEMVDDFQKNLRKLVEETDPGTMDRLLGIPGASMDALFALMGVKSAASIVKGANKARKLLTGAVKTEEELIKLYRDAFKPNLTPKQIKQRMKNNPQFAAEQERINKMSLKELQAKGINEGIVYTEDGSAVLQSKAPIYFQYTKQGSSPSQIIDKSGKVISKIPGKGNVVIGFGEIEKTAGQIPKVIKPNTFVTRQIKLPGGRTMQVGVYNYDRALTAMGEAAVARGAGAAATATEEAVYEIGKGNEVGLSEFGEATVMAFPESIMIGAEELKILREKMNIDVLVANGQTIVLNQKALPQYTSKIKYKASELGFENSRIEHGSPIGIKGEPDPLFRQRADVDQTVLKPKEKGFTLSESTGSSSSGTGIYFSQPANMQKNLKSGMPNANPTGYALSSYGEGYIYESTIKPDAVIVDQEGMKKILNEAGYTLSTSMDNIPEEAYKILREEGVDIVVGSFEKGAVNEYNVINPEAITELSQTAKTGAKKYQVTHADRGSYQKLLDFNTKAEAEAFVEKMGGKLKQKDYTGLRKDGTFDRYEHPETGHIFGIREVRGDKEEILGPVKQKEEASEVYANVIDGMDDADIPLDVNEALVKLTDQQFKQVVGTDKWVYEMLVAKDPARAARNFKVKVDTAKNNKGVQIINNTESFTKAAQDGNMQFTDILKVKTAANDGKQEAIDWVSSDQFIQRVMDSRGVSKEKARLIQMEFLNNIENTALELKAYNEQAKVRGTFSSAEGVVRVHAPKVEGFDGDNIRQLEDLAGTVKHEYLHAANVASGENMKGIEFLPPLKAPEGAKPVVRQNIAYLNRKPEQQVRAVKAIQLAQQAGVIKADEKFTVDKLNKLRDYIEEEGLLFGVAGYGELGLLLDPIKSGNTFKDKDIVNLLNTAYQYALPLIGGAGAAMLSDSDEDMDAAMMAALPLMIFGRGKKINLKNVYKNIRNFFKTVPALKNVLFKQSELESYVLKNLPAKITKELGPNLTFEKLVEVKPEVVKNAVVDYVAETLPSSADLDPATTMSYDKGYVTESFMKEDYGKNPLKSKKVGTTFKELAPNGPVSRIAKDGMVSTEEALAIINKGSMPHLKVPRIKAELEKRYGEDIPEKISLDELNDIANLVTVPLNITVSGQITKENGIVYDNVNSGLAGSYGNPIYGHRRIGFDKAPINSEILNAFKGLNAEEATAKFNQINEEFAKEVKSSRDKYAALKKEQDAQAKVIRDTRDIVDKKMVWIDYHMTKEDWYAQASQNKERMNEVNAYSEAVKNHNLANGKYQKLAMQMRTVEKRSDYKKRQHDELADALDDFVKGIIPEFTVNNRTLIFSNNARLPGYGVTNHDTPEGTMGHVHTTEKNTDEETLVVTQIQSDAAQRSTLKEFSKKGIEKLYVDQEWNDMNTAIRDKIDEIQYYNPRVGIPERDRMRLIWENVRKGITNGNSYDTHAKEIAELERYLGESLFATESKSMGRTKVNDTLLADRLGPDDNTLKDAKAYQKDSRIRMIEETIHWAAQNGYTKVRFPAPQTVVNIQDYEHSLNYPTPKEGLGNNIANVYETYFLEATLANYLDFSKTKAAFNTKAGDKDIIPTVLTDTDKIKLLYEIHRTDLYDGIRDIEEPIVDLVDNAALAKKIVESGKPLWEYVQKTDSSGKPIKGKELKSDFYNEDQIKAIKKLLQRGERQLKHALESQVNGTDPFRNIDKFNMLPDDKYKIVIQHKKDYEDLQKRFPNVKFLTEKPIVGSKGNYWYEFVIPKEILDGVRPIISHKKGGVVEAELTKEEVQKYIDQGYVLDELT